VYYKLLWQRQPLDFTGHYLGVDFKDGIGETKCHLYYNALRFRYCKDISPPEMVEARSKRDLKKILVVRTGAYGDLMMVTPAIRGLREKYPDAEIDFVGRYPNIEILYQNPDLNRVLNDVRVTDIGLLCPNYDEVFDLSHSIELNPESDWVNAQELSCKWLQVEPKSYEPVIGVTEQEMALARDMLHRNGVDLAKYRGSIIMMHIESTAPLRRMPDVVALTTAQHYAELGYKVIFNGVNTELSRVKLAKLPCCGRTNTVIMDSNFQNIQYPCKFCNKTVVPQITKLHSNIHFLQHEGHETLVRPKFFTVAYADVFVGVDSSFSHIAAAFGRPSVLLYGPFDASLRAKHWPHALCIQPQPACGPCHQLAPWCVRYQNGIPPCTNEITPQQLVDAIDAHLGLNGKKFTGNNSMQFALPEGELDVTRDCPACGHTHSEPVVRKKNVIYRKCDQCRSLFTNREVLSPSTGSVYQADFLSLSASFVHGVWASKVLDMLKKNNIDQPRVAEYRPLNSAFKDEFGKLNTGEYVSLEDVAPDSLDIVVGIRSLERAPNPREALADIKNKLKPGGFLMLYGPAADAWNRNNAWAHLNTPVAGDNKTIFSSEGIQKITKEAGFQGIEYKPFTNVEEQMVLVRKPSNEPIS